MTVPGFTKSCEWCGGPIPETKRVDAVFCCKRCKALHNMAVVRQGRLDDKRNRPPCLHCGAAIPVEALAFQRFCSATCRERARYERRKAAV